MYNWSDYVAPENMEAFKAEFGVKNFVYDTFANNDELLAKLAAGASGYDFACPTAEFMPQMAEEGYIQKLDYSRIPNMAHIDPALLSQSWDPNNEYHVPKDYGTTGIMYRSKIVTEPLTSWREFYDSPRASTRAGRSWSTRPATCHGHAAQDAGLLAQLDRPGTAQRGKEMLLDLAPHILALDSDTYRDKLASEEAVLCLGWTGPLVELRGNPDTADTKYVVPSEGTLFWMDVWVMMADAPHPNGTYAWFDFIHAPEGTGPRDQPTGYATPNLEAKKLVPQEMLDRPGHLPARRRDEEPRRRRSGLQRTSRPARRVDRVQESSRG